MAENEVYDLTGLKCPLPVLKTRNRMRNMSAGQQLRVKTTDPLAVIDMPHFCTENGHRLIATETERTGENASHIFTIEKGS